MSVFVSIASYRDPDLVNTVGSALENAAHPEALFFSVVSQAEDDEHPNLSFVPDNQIRYIKRHWSESLGACWAREIATRDIAQEFILQIDSHSRFREGWDELVVGNWRSAAQFWGPRLILTQYPEAFEVDLQTGCHVYHEHKNLLKLDAVWDEASGMVQSSPRWPTVVDTKHGDEIYFLSANCMFTTAEVMREIPYDPLLYFTGEEPSLALRAYTRGIRLVSPVVRFMFTNYNRENGRENFHWRDHEEWWRLNRKSYARLERIFKGEDLGVFGIGSRFLWEQYQRVTGIDFLSKHFVP